MKVLRQHRLPAKLIILTASALLAVTACGNFYPADVQGYIRDLETDEGIDGATVYFYRRAPDSAGEEGFFTNTTTATFNANPGYYTSRVVWQSLIASFGPEGDSGEVFIAVTHPDYSGVIETVSGVFSDSVNILGDIYLDRTAYIAPAVRGRIINPSGEGVNGVRVILDLASTTSDSEDYIGFTATQDGQAGVFEFTNVTWNDAAASGSTDTESVTLSIDDNDWELDAVANAAALTFDITSDEENQMPLAVSAKRIARTNFQISVQGVVEDRLSDGSVVPWPGTQVELNFNLPGAAVSGTGSPLTTITDAFGNYEFIVQWTVGTAAEETILDINSVRFDLDNNGNFGSGGDEEFTFATRDASSVDPVHNLPRLDPNP